MKNLPVALCLCMVIALEFYHHQNCRQVKLLGGEISIKSSLRAAKSKSSFLFHFFFILKYFSAEKTDSWITTNLKSVVSSSFL